MSSLKFDQIADIELDVLHTIEEQAFSGSITIDSRPNEYVAAPSGDGGYIVSSSNRKGLQGTIEIHPAGVIYKDSAGAIIHREARMRFPVSDKSIEYYYLPILNSQL